MPGFDKTGPQGQGAMTGRKMGKCTGKAGATNENDANNADQQGRGLGLGRGRGGGRRGGGQGLGLGRRKGN